ncbi:aldo/keto reductase [Roseococcus pinisoli]|uniref:Aldo/keto reductase n=1 Tax=Roseococcus pinisoli TaxID=2835040 RepID=A0ABS5QAF3_9PROT|nr:aldo/keto reductase [Roseococcus pinisoli]MBS7810675.1 aldo/keto reductase [Roseococcus pinisoli]
MKQRNLGTSGLLVSTIGLGCNNFGGRLDLEGTRAVIHAAFDHGITLFDTADMYGNQGGSETLMGQVLGDRRKDIVLATKFGLPMDGENGRLKGGSRRYIMSAVEASLKRLKTDWIDLYQYHKPDPLTPTEETLRALDDLVKQGKVRYIGCSNLPGWQVVEAQWTSKHLGLNSFVSCQDEYSLLVRKAEQDVVPVAARYGMGLLPYFPLASGMLTGKYRRGEPTPAGTRMAGTDRYARYQTEGSFDVVEKLDAYAKARGHTLVELAFSWLLSKAPVSSVIAGATKPEQIAQNVKAGDWALTAAEIAEIEAIAAPA